MSLERQTWINAKTSRQKILFFSVKKKTFYITFLNLQLDILLFFLIYKETYKPETSKVNE